MGFKPDNTQCVNSFGSHADSALGAMHNNSVSAMLIALVCVCICL